jgi:hypothetical protein
LTLTGFPHQTSESVTIVRVVPSPCVEPQGGPQYRTCQGSSNLFIPGIGEGRVDVFVVISTVGVLEPAIRIVGVSIAFLPGQTGPFSILLPANISAVTETINIPGIGVGQAIFQLLD